MFGDDVCESDLGGKCVLNPQTRAWLESTNEAMAGGHCFGFSVTAELLWQQKLLTTTFGASSTPGLTINNNQSLESQIAYDWALQLLNSVQSQRVSGTPNQILNKLRKVLKAHPTDTYTIAIWKRDGTGGHAITPYAVVNQGGRPVRGDDLRQQLARHHTGHLLRHQSRHLDLQRGRESERAG
jgi:hypothetical protein